MSTEEMIERYTVQHLTCAEIGALAGVSRASVWKHLKTAYVQAREGERVEVQCAHCGQWFEQTRRRWRKQRRHYCKAACYLAELANPAYVASRQGQRMARHVAARFYPLQFGNVVHHHDSDNTHNHPANLAVFASQAEHMSFERGGEAKPLWDGRTLTVDELDAVGYAQMESPKMPRPKLVARRKASRNDQS